MSVPNSSQYRTKKPARRGSQGKVVLMFDGDKAGQECKDDGLARLVTQIYVKVINLPEGKQPDNLSNEEIKKFLS